MKLTHDPRFNVYRVRGTITLPDGSTSRISASGDTKTAAREAFERRRLVEIDRVSNPAAPTASGEKPFVAFAREWMTTYPAAASNRETTKTAQAYHLRVRLIPYFEALAAERGGAPILLREITPREIDKLIAHLKEAPRMSPIRRAPAEPGEGPKAVESVKRRARARRSRGPEIVKTLAPLTIRNITQTLRRLLVTARKWGEIETVPEFESVRVPRSKVDFLSFDEAERLLAATADPEDLALLMTGLKAGLRAGELLGLQWTKIDFVRLVIRVDEQIARKGTKLLPVKAGPRDVPISATLAAALKKHRHLRGPFVFCNEIGQPFNRYDLKRKLEKWLKRAGVRRVHPHLLRHTFASHLVMRAVPIIQVQAWLGHASITMTMRYAHLAPGVGASMVNVLDGPAPAGAREEKSGS